MSEPSSLPPGWQSPCLAGRGALSWRALRAVRGGALTRFLADLSSPERAQQQALERVLDSARGTRFAREHGLDSVRDLDGYRAAVPIRPPEHLEPWLRAQAAGEPDALTRHRVRSFVQTSGTTGSPRQLPVTEPWARCIAQAQAAWVLAMVAEQPGLLAPGARALASVGRAVEGTTSGGVPFGSNTGRMRAAQAWWVRLAYAVPAMVAELEGHELRTYVSLRLALAVDVRSWTTANPSTVLGVCRAMERHREALAADLVDSTLCRGPARALDRATRRRLRPWIWRRRRLPTDWRPASFWPNLLCVNCWKGGQAGFYLDRLPQALGADPPVREVGISASEGHLAVPLHSSWCGGVAAVGGHLIELVPELGGPPCLPHQVERGGVYRVVLSTTAGLYRYDLGDLVSVEGWFRRAPCLRFLRRAGQVRSMTGEKLTGEQVVQVARAALGSGVVGFIMCPILGDPGHYVLAFEGPVAPPALAVDRALRHVNIEYDSKRTSERLAPVRVVALRPGTFDAWRRRRAAQGAAEGQIKEPIFGTLEALRDLQSID